MTTFVSLISVKIAFLQPDTHFTYGTVFAVASRILTFISLETFAFATNALAMARTQFVDVFSVGCDTGFVGSSAFAGSVSGYVPFGEAFAFTTIANPVVGPGAKFTIVAVAGEVIAFAIITGDDLKLIVLL